MKLSELIECLDCGEVDAPGRTGRCQTCGSAAIRWLRSSMWIKPEPQKAQPVLCGIDREFLRQMGVEA